MAVAAPPPKIWVNSKTFCPAPPVIVAEPRRRQGYHHPSHPQAYPCFRIRGCCWGGGGHCRYRSGGLGGIQRFAADPRFVGAENITLASIVDHAVGATEQRRVIRGKNCRVPCAANEHKQPGGLEDSQVGRAACVDRRYTRRQPIVSLPLPVARRLSIGAPPKTVAPEPLRVMAAGQAVRPTSGSPPSMSALIAPLL